MITPIHLRKVSARYQQGQQRLCHGLQLEFVLGEQEARFSLLPELTFSSAAAARGYASNRRALETRLTTGGHVHITNSFRLIQRLCALPLTREDAKKESLTWRLALHQLAEPFNRILGEFSLTSPRTQVHSNDDSIAEQICCHWQLDSHNQSQSGVIQFPIDTLFYWLNAAPWQALSAPVYQQLALQQLTTGFALSVGRLSLFRSEALQLGVGDVLLPQQTFFDLQGNGMLQIATQSVGLRWQQRTQFLITDVQDTAMNQTTQSESGTVAAGDVTAPQDAESLNTEAINKEPLRKELAQHSEDESSPVNEPFADLPLTFTIEVGEVCLTLQQLQQLSLGSVLTANGMSAGQAVLKHRDRIVGRGELVDVEGRMGLQLQSIEMGLASGANTSATNTPMNGDHNRQHGVSSATSG